MATGRVGFGFRSNQTQPEQGFPHPKSDPSRHIFWFVMPYPPRDWNGPGLLIDVLFDFKIITKNLML